MLLLPSSSLKQVTCIPLHNLRCTCIYTIGFGNLEPNVFFAEGDALSVFSELHQCGVGAASD